MNMERAFRTFRFDAGVHNIVVNSLLFIETHSKHSPFHPETSTCSEHIDHYQKVKRFEGLPSL